MKLIKKLNKNRKIKYLIYPLISIIMLYIIVAIYSYVFEREELSIDRYNFNQLKEVKKTLKNVPEEKMLFYSIKDFNEIFKTNITPIKNCYFISSYNGNKPYIFGFKLESLIYKFVYFGPNYAYPSYSIPIEQFCFGEGSPGGCSFTSKQPFIDGISNPCE